MVKVFQYFLFLLFSLPLACVAWHGLESVGVGFWWRIPLLALLHYMNSIADGFWRDAHA